MPDIRPFRGVRYDLARVGDLSSVVAPPYDVIGPALQDTLYKASPYNVVRLELNKEEPTDDAESNRYTRAARTLKEWMRDGILTEDSHPSLYLCHQTFVVEGNTYIRKGFIGRVRLEPLGEGRIYAHEQTLAGPKADRLALINATKFNLSPVFGLYPDALGEVIGGIDAAVRDRTPLEATDQLGVVSQLWPVTDQATHTAVQGMMATKSIFIADGHHRYETGLNYRKKLIAEGATLSPDDPANFTMMMLVGMADPGLLILPTHRLIKGFPGITTETLIRLLEHDFEIIPIGKGPQAAFTAWENLEINGNQDMLAFCTVSDRQWLTARLRTDTKMDTLAPEHSHEWRALGVSILHELVLKSLLAPLGKAACSYVHLLDEVTDCTSQGGCDIACLVPPVSMNDVEAIGQNVETMPPKSTYFYPKLLGGLVLNPIR